MDPKPLGPERGVMTADTIEEIVQNRQQQTYAENWWDAASNETILSRAARVLEDEVAGQRDDLYRGMGFDKTPTRDEISVGNYLFMSGVASIGVLLGAREEVADYDKTEMFDELTAGIPHAYHDEIMENDNLGVAKREAYRIRERESYNRRSSVQYDDGAASVIGTFVDIDAPLIAMSNGALGAAKVARKTAKGMQALGASNKTTTAVATMAQGAAQGLIVGTGLGAVDNQIDSTTEWDDVLMYGVTGAVFGALLPGQVDDLYGTRTRAHESAQQSQQDILNRMGQMDDDFYRDPFDVDDIPTGAVLFERPEPQEN